MPAICTGGNNQATFSDTFMSVNWNAIDMLFVTRPIKKYLLLLLALGMVLPGGAQEIVSGGPAKLITRFGFEQLTGGVVIVRGTFDKSPDSLNFIFDTGSGGISLDSTTARQMQLELSPSDRTIRGIAGIKNVEYARNHTLNLPGLSVSGLDFHINDYELLTGVYGVKIDGIIGYSFLRRYLVTIDYDKRILSVYTPGDFKYPRGGYLLRPAITGLPMQYAYVGDNRGVFGRFYLDTGAGLNLLLSNEFVGDSSLFTAKKNRYPTVAEGLGGKKEMEMAVLKTFKLGNYKFKRVPIYLFDDEFNVTSYPQLGGLIGNDILRRFNVVINYPRSEIHLIPNSHFRDEFDYSYTGLGLYAANGTIYITDVLKNSPAEEAGLKVGDILFAVDNNLSNSMQAYRNILMQSGRRVKLLVKRQGELIQTTMIIENIK
jgi:hypothetical protein